MHRAGKAELVSNLADGEASWDICVCWKAFRIRPVTAHEPWTCSWKALEQQPVGWNPDPGDGLRFNIRTILSVPDVGKKGAGVLSDKPQYKMEKILTELLVELLDYLSVDQKNSELVVIDFGRN